MLRKLNVVIDKFALAGRDDEAGLCQGMYNLLK